MAASAGGLQAYLKVLSELPRQFPAPILIVQHLAPTSVSMMASILKNRVQLDVRQAVDGDVLCGGCVYVAPPDHHMLVTDHETIELTQTRALHFVRPSADALFESVAGNYRDAAVGVVLTGSGTDGHDGVIALKAAGALIIAQDEETSEYFGMPGAAIATGLVDMILPLTRIAPAMIDLFMCGNGDKQERVNELN